MTTEPLAELTLGQWLALQAARLVEQRSTVVSWLDRTGPLLARVEQRATDGGRRFERVEVPVPSPWAVGDPFDVPDRFDLPRPFDRPEPGPFERPDPGPPTSVPAPSPDAGAEAVDGGTELPAAVRDRLAPLTGRPDGIRVHEGPRSDLAARELHAEAVTVGQDIHLRTGRFRPDNPAGLALLAHEVTHALSARRPGSAWRRGSPADRAEEELAARRNAAAVLSGRPPGWHPQPSGDGAAPLPGAARSEAHPPPLPAGARGAVPPPAAFAVGRSSTAPVPMAAEEGRVATSGVPVPPGEATGTRSLVAALRRELLREIRTDAERGG